MEYSHKDLDKEKETRVKHNLWGEYNPDNFWEEYGKEYRKYFKDMEDTKDASSLKINAQELIARIYKLNPKSILEVGCGFGRLLPFIVETLKIDVNGIEFSTSMIEDSKTYLKDYDKSNKIHIKWGKAQDIPHKDGEFELVYTHACLTHIPPKDIPKVVSEISRVASKYIIHVERYIYPYEHSHPHHWTHLLAPLYIDLGWEMIENTEINEKHNTKVLVLKK